MDKEAFIDAVDEKCEEYYEVFDGGDLAAHLLESGVISIDMGVNHAAQIVAQHVLQA